MLEGEKFNRKKVEQSKGDWKGQAEVGVSCSSKQTGHGKCCWKGRILAMTREDTGLPIDYMEEEPSLQKKQLEPGVWDTRMKMPFMFKNRKRLVWWNTVKMVEDEVRGKEGMIQEDLASYSKIFS